MKKKKRIRYGYTPRGTFGLYDWGNGQYGIFAKKKDYLKRYHNDELIRVKILEQL